MRTQVSWVTVQATACLVHAPSSMCRLFCSLYHVILHCFSTLFKTLPPYLYAIWWDQAASSIQLNKTSMPWSYLVFHLTTLLPFSLFRGNKLWERTWNDLHDHHNLLWVKQLLSVPVLFFCRLTMELIAQQAPHTALFSNLLKPEIEKKHNSWNGW